MLEINDETGISALWKATRLFLSGTLLAFDAGTKVVDLAHISINGDSYYVTGVRESDELPGIYIVELEKTDDGSRTEALLDLESTP